MKSKRDITDKQRTANYIRFQINQMDEIINDAKERELPYVYSTPYIKKRSSLYKELRQLNRK